jgi:hypothetical protein
LSYWRSLRRALPCSTTIRTQARPTEDASTGGGVVHEIPQCSA